MDELEILLNDLREEALPADSLARIAPRVQRTLRRRRMTRLALATAAVMAVSVLSLYRAPLDVALPEPGEAIIAVPDLLLTIPAPATLSYRRAKPKAIVVGEGTLQLASTDQNVVIYWSL